MIKMLSIYVIAGIFIYLILRTNNVNINILKYTLYESILFILLNSFKVDSKYYVVILTMSGIIICDLKYYIIPDSFHLLLFINRLLFISNINELFSSILNSLIMALIIYITFIIHKYLLHKETIGGGDIKLLFSLGIYCSYMVNVYCLMTSCVFALLYIYPSSVLLNP